MLRWRNSGKTSGRFSSRNRLQLCGRGRVPQAPCGSGESGRREQKICGRERNCRADEPAGRNQKNVQQKIQRDRAHDQKHSVFLLPDGIQQIQIELSGNVEQNSSGHDGQCRGGAGELCSEQDCDDPFSRIVHDRRQRNASEQKKKICQQENAPDFRILFLLPKVDGNRQEHQRKNHQRLQNLHDRLRNVVGGNILQI